VEAELHKMPNTEDMHSWKFKRQCDMETFSVKSIIKETWVLVARVAAKSARFNAVGVGHPHGRTAGEVECYPVRVVGTS